MVTRGKEVALTLEEAQEMAREGRDRHGHDVELRHASGDAYWVRWKNHRDPDYGGARARIHETGGWTDLD